MSDLEKNIYVSSLYNFYKNLLTEKQRDIFYSYYYLDIGLTEIGVELNISRQAVLDSIKKTENILKTYEDKIGLYKLYNEQTKIIEDINSEKDLHKLNQILKLWEG
ncbi:MAG: hypothetical protein E7359_03815 [Clostridiales bacterium]|nr:hypothetical protein [Clostridiales bacterium]